ncbi:MAG TPA: ATP-binding protein [Frankiaceae bacterium]|nr:ATP-binding protein [Frankiaceae bacterium]
MTNADAASVLADCARELLCLTGPDLEIVAAAGPWAQAVGVEPAGVRLDDLVVAADRPALRAYRDAVGGGLPHDPIDVTVVAHGRDRVFDVVLRAVEGGAVASLRDVTEIRLTDYALGAINERLQRINDELRRSNEELQRFAYVASHDLSEPLRMVTSYCALLVDEYGARLDPTAHEYLAFATDGAMRMRTLIDDLLAYSRVSSVAAPAVRVDLGDVLADAVHDLGAAIAACGADVTVGPLPAVRGNEAQLRRLAVNLVGNALKFRSEGTVPRIAVTAEREGATVTLSVADNGIGIAERHRQRIFVMFKRLHGRGAYDGNGIGLAMCKRIAELHGGTVWVEDAPGGGSVFRVTLVAADLPAAAPAVVDVSGAARAVTA